VSKIHARCTWRIDYTKRNALDTSQPAPYRDGMFHLDRSIADCRAALATSCPAAPLGALAERAVAEAARAKRTYALANERGTMDRA